MAGEELDTLRESYGREFLYHDENVAMLAWYGRRLAERLRARGCRSLLSLGIGHRAVSRTIVENLADVLQTYVIVEGSKEIIREFRSDVHLPSFVQIVESFFEDYHTDRSVDAIEMGFVLEHVADPAFVVGKYAKLLAPQGSLFITVPNAMSLHRVVGKHAGLLRDLCHLSEHDRALGHKRYFTLESITKLVTDAGLVVVRTEGIYMKPFSTAQMKSLHLSPEVVEALFTAGIEHPDMTNAIAIEAVVGGG